MDDGDYAMMSVITELSGCFLECLIIVCFFLKSFPCKKNENYEKILVFSIILIIDLLLTFLSAPTMIYSSVFISSVFLMQLLFLENTISEKILYAILILTTIGIISILAINTTAYVFSASYLDIVSSSNIAKLIIVLIIKIIQGAAIFVVYVIKKKLYHMLGVNEYATIIGMLLTTFIIVMILRYALMNWEQRNICILIVILFMLIVDALIVYFLINITQKKRELIEKKLIELQLEQNRKETTLVQNSYSEAIQIKHDMKHYIDCSLSLARDGEYTKLMEYLEELSDNKLIFLSDYIRTDNAVLNAVLNSKIQIMKQKGIYVTYSIKMGKIEIADTDLSAILSNLLDNAIESCEKNKRKSCVDIRIFTSAAYLFIHIANTVEEDVAQNNPELKTTKKEKNLHGIGIHSVKRIVSQYDGTTKFHQKKNKFIADITVKNRRLCLYTGFRV